MEAQSETEMELSKQHFSICSQSSSAGSSTQLTHSQVSILSHVHASSGACPPVGRWVERTVEKTLSQQTRQITDYQGVETSTQPAWGI